MDCCRFCGAQERSKYPRRWLSYGSCRWRNGGKVKMSQRIIIYCHVCQEDCKGYCQQLAGEPLRCFNCICNELSRLKQQLKESHKPLERIASALEKIAKF